MIAKSAIMCKHKVLSMSANPEEWSDDDIVFVLSHAGSDVSGNLLLGDDAYRGVTSLSHALDFGASTRMSH